MGSRLALAVVLVLLTALASPAIATPAGLAQQPAALSSAPAPDSGVASWQCWDPGNPDPCHMLTFSGAGNVEVLSPTDAWAAGGDAVWRWDGSHWSSVADAPVLVDLDMQSSTDGWGVDGQSIYRWDGTAWTAMGTPSGSYLQNIDMFSPDAGWAVGYNTLLHWDGATWTSDPTAAGFYRGVDAVSANEAWAVGGVQDYYSPSLIAHWTGSSWIHYPSPVTGFLASVSMVSSTDSWAVGSWGRIMHWNGATWSQAASPTGQALLGVTMTAWNDGWAVGDGVILHYDGQAWTIFATSPSLRGVGLSSSGGEGWAVGTNDFLHWDGQAWTRYEYDLSAGFGELSMVSETDGWAVSEGALAHWDGNTWTPQVPAGLTGPIHAIDMATATEGWIVGTMNMWHWNGSEWTYTPCPVTTCYLFDVKMLSPTVGWAVGSSNYRPLVLRWDGNTWSPMPFDFDATLYAVDATSETDVWVASGWIAGYPYPTCGTDIFHWDGTSWTAMSAPPGIQPHVIDILSPTEGWAAGGCGYMGAWAFTINHWDGHVWSSMELPPFSPEIVTLSAVSSTDAWAASWHTLWHWDGSAWTAVAPPAPERNVNAIEMLSSTEGWAAGDEGVILRFGPYPDLQLDAQLQPDPVQAGETLTLTLGVQNDGAGVATGVVLTATLSLSATLSSAPPGCVQQGGVIRCERGDLLPRASDTLTLAVTMDAQATGALFADVEVAAQEPDPVSGNNARRLTAFINARWDVDLPVMVWR